MVFLRPTIVRNGADARRHTTQRYDYLRNTGLRGDPAALVELDAMVRDYLDTAAPVSPAVPAQPALPPPTTPSP